MGYGSVILVISVIIISGVLLLSMTSATSDADEELNEYHHKTLARDAAVTGLELAVRCLADPATPGSWNPSIDGPNCDFGTTSYSNGSTFRVELDFTPSGDSVDVTARGFNGLHRDPNTGATEPISQVIFARYAWEKADGGIPPAFRNAISADDYDQSQGTTQIFGINNTTNASIHINEDLSTNNMYVYGYGTYTRPSSLMPGLINNFVPNVDLNGPQPNVYKTDTLHIPQIDISALRNIARGLGGVSASGAYIDTSPLGAPPPDFVLRLDAFPNSTLDFTSPGSWPWAPPYPTPYPYNCDSGSCGTKENPFVLFVEHGLTMTRPAQFKGYGIIVSNADVFINPEGVLGGVYGEIIDDETTVMLATSQTIEVGETGFTSCLGLGPSPLAPSACLASDHTHGLTLYAQAGIDFYGTPYMVGSVGTPKVAFNDGTTRNIIYAAPPEAITDPGFEFQNPIGPVLVSYSEW